MRIAVAADERTGIAETVVEELRRRGHDAWFGGEPSAEADDRANVGHLAEIETVG
jgi:hypothetical protein